MPKRFAPVPQIPIAAVLEALGAENVPRLRGGRSKKILCLWHTDSTPSLSVTEYGIRCFTCGKTGDAISLLIGEENLNFPDALARAASLAGVEIDAVPEERSGERWSGSIFDL